MRLKLGDTDKKTADKMSAGGGKPYGERRRRSKNLFVFFVFILISLAFWLLQSLQSTYRMRISVPIVYDGLSPNIGYSKQGLTDEVVFVVEDKGMQLLAYSVQDFVPLRVSRTDSKGGKGKLILTKRQLTDDFQRQLASTTRILSANPSEISLDIHALKEKRVPIILGFDPPVPIGYQLAAPSIEPAVITIYGEDNVIDAIKQVQTQNYRLDPVKRVAQFDVALAVPPGVELQTKKVHVSLKAEQLTERSFDLPIDPMDSPPGVSLRLLPSRARLYVTLPVDRFSSLDEKEFRLMVSYLSATDSASTSSLSLLPIQLKQKPDWVVRYRIEPSAVQYILETNGRTTDAGNRGRNR